MTDRPDIDEFASKLQQGGWKITGGKYDPTPKERISRMSKRAIEAIQDFKINAEIWDDDAKKGMMRIEFAYPRLDGHIKEIELGLYDVRASDGIKIHYDFERDGYVVMQPYIIEKQMEGYIDASTETWEEVGFFQSWALENKGFKLS